MISTLYNEAGEIFVVVSLCFCHLTAELASLASLTGQLVLGIPCSYFFCCAGVTDGLLCPSATCAGDGHTNFRSQLW